MNSTHDTMFMEALMLLSSEGSDADVGSVDAERQSISSSPSTVKWQTPLSVESNGTASQRFAKPSQQLRRRKRSSKCTYAARREEVERLRSLAFYLETDLRELQEVHRRRQQLARQHAQQEHTMLTQSQSENARLRSLLADSEARIRAAHQQQ